MRTVIASGKGGTGKTLLATSTVALLAEAGQPSVYLDADVSEPNGHLFLRPDGVSESAATVNVPVLARPSCSGCGECQRICAFGAILALPDRVMVLEPLCHGCGACLLACPENALEERSRRIGVVRTGHSGPTEVRWAVLDVGEPRGTPLIGALGRSLAQHRDPVIIDAPPGTSCLAMSSARLAQRAVLVTEPTPMGLHDVRGALGLVRALRLPAAAVINRSDLGDDRVERYLRDEGVPVLARIPFSEEVARACAAGAPALEVSPELRRAATEIADLLGGEARLE
jgi:MinD superfamily P-loop ATPase